LKVPFFNQKQKVIMLSVEQIKQIIIGKPKRKIPRGQLMIYKALWNYTGFMPQKEFIDKVRDGDAQSLSGVLLAFTNRIAFSGFFEDESHSGKLDVILEESNAGYSLTDNANKAINEIPKLVGYLTTRSLGDIWKDKKGLDAH
jgi:hypothetical protein